LNANKDAIEKEAKMERKIEMESSKVLDPACGSGSFLNDSCSIKAHKKVTRKKKRTNHYRSTLLCSRRDRKGFVNDSHYVRPYVNTQAKNSVDEQHFIQFVDLVQIKEFTDNKMRNSPLAQALARQPDKIPASLFLQLLPLLLQLGEVS
jgi:hypothetical protein